MQIDSQTQWHHCIPDKLNVNVTHPPHLEEFHRYASRSLCVFCRFGILTHWHIPLPPDPWFSGKSVNGSLQPEKGMAWSTRRHFLQRGAFMKQLAPIKVSFFFPTWTATHKKRNWVTYFNNAWKTMPWKAQGSAERWWFIGGFLDLLCGLCLLSRKIHPRSWSCRYIYIYKPLHPPWWDHEMAP